MTLKMFSNVQAEVCNFVLASGLLLERRIPKAENLLQAMSRQGPETLGKLGQQL